MRLSLRMLFSFLCLSLTSLSWGNYVKVDPRNSQQLLGIDGRALNIRGINRFAIYEAEDNRDNLSTEEYFQLLKKQGFNLVRVFVREGYIAEGARVNKNALESALGVYSQAHMEELRTVFEMSRKYKIYVVLCLFDHYYLKHAWVARNEDSDVALGQPTPYYVKGTQSDHFYQSPILRVFQRNRVRHVVSAFKHEPYLLAWEPMNEVNGVMKDSYVKETTYVVDWYNDMARTIKENDPNHLVTASLTGDVFWDNHGNYFPWTGLYASTWTDIIQVHSYRFDGADRDFATTGFRKEIEEAKKFNKPVWVGEFGVKTENPHWQEITEQAMDVATELGVPALMWTHRFDPYGDLTEEKIRIYHSVYPDMVQKEE